MVIFFYYNLLSISSSNNFVAIYNNNAVSSKDNFCIFFKALYESPGAFLLEIVTKCRVHTHRTVDIALVLCVSEMSQFSLQQILLLFYMPYC